MSCKFVLVVKSQCVHIARINDFERAHLVTIGSGSRIDEHFVANLHLLERAKECVTVTGDDHISWLLGHGRARNMSEADAQSLRRDGQESAVFRHGRDLQILRVAVLVWTVDLSALGQEITLRFAHVHPCMAYSTDADATLIRQISSSVRPRRLFCRHLYDVQRNPNTAGLA